LSVVVKSETENVETFKNIYVKGIEISKYDTNLVQANKNLTQ